MSQDKLDVVLRQIESSGIGFERQSAHGEEVIELQSVADISQCIAILSSHFEQLMDICAVDYLTSRQRKRPAPRFALVYNLLSLSNNQRIRVKARIGDCEHAPSVSGIYLAAAWYEREVWDMYGILFTGHPDLRRILTDYGFVGHPLRKDFPLSGHVEVVYDPSEKRVVKRKVSLQQEHRDLDCLSHWVGTEYAVPHQAAPTPLPGDEKAGLHNRK